MKFNPFPLILLLLLFSFSVATAAEDPYAPRDWKADQKYQEMLKAAKTGDAEAQYNLVRSYRGILDPPFGWQEAEELLRKSAEQGYVPAALELGLIYAQGEHPRLRATLEEDELHDQGIAFKWNLVAAKEGNEQGKGRLKSFMPPAASAKGTELSFREAFDWYSEEADQDDAHVQQVLGRMYAYGLGTKPDGAEALKHLTKAAELKNATALCDLGVIYLNGTGVQKDTAAALKWLRQSAEEGSICGCKELGKMYRDGIGMPVDLLEAFFWFSRADKWVREAGDAPFWEGDGTLSVLNLIGEKNVIEIRSRAFSLPAPNKP